MRIEQRYLHPLPELGAQYEHCVRSAPDMSVPFPASIQAIVDHPLFQRLRAIRQLAFVDRVYPDATHSRFAHSLGVYGNAIRYVQALSTNRWSVQFRNVLTDGDIRALLVAALLHDIGQYPYAHAIEDSRRWSSGNIGVADFDHESLTLRLIQDRAFRTSLTAEYGYYGPDLGELIVSAGSSPDDVAAVLTGKAGGSVSGRAARLLNSLIDGPIDVDKLDYLRRDSHHAGVQFGFNIDVGRLLNTLAIAEFGKGADGETILEIGVAEKGVCAAEEILLARTHMFTQVYWHRTVRAHEAVLATAIGKLRRATSNFDEWLCRAALAPATSDSLFLGECLKLCSGKGDSSVEYVNSGLAQTYRAEALSLLGSLEWSHGRSQYKQLVEFRTRESPLAYRYLVQIRDAAVAVKSKPQFLDELSVNLASRLSAKFQQAILPKDLVFDIPAIRSSANSAWIVGTEVPNVGKASKLADHATFWQSFGNSFDISTRTVRLFVPASVREKLNAFGLTFKNEVLEQLFLTAIHVGKQLADQTELEL